MNNFQEHRRLSEQLLETQAAIRKPELKRVTGRIFIIIHLIYKKAKDCKNHKCSFKKYFVKFKDLQKTFISWRCPFKVKKKIRKLSIWSDKKIPLDLNNKEEVHVVKYSMC